MSKKLSFREALERQARGPTADRGRSESVATPSRSVKVHLRRIDPIHRPIDLARLLTSCGLSLRKAHKAVERLSAGDVVALELVATDPALLTAKFRDLGVGASAVQMPTVDPRKVRERFHLTQDEFADRFLLSVDTVRNWEQGRNNPDPTTRLLLKVMEDYPQVLEAILCNATVFQMGAYRVAANSLAFQTQMASQTLFGLMELAGRFVADAPEFRPMNASFNSYIDVRAHTWVVAPRRTAISCR